MAKNMMPEPQAKRSASADARPFERDPNPLPRNYPDVGGFVKQFKQTADLEMRGMLAVVKQ